MIFRGGGDAEGQQKLPFWQEAFHQKGMSGSAIVFPNGRKECQDTFPPKSLGDSFVAVFVGCDPADLSSAFLGRVDAAEFRAVAAKLQSENPVYQKATLDEVELGKWPVDGTMPRVFEQCCVVLPAAEGDEEEVPGDVGPAQQVSGHVEEGEAAIVAPYVSAFADEDDDGTMARAWAVAGAKLEEATAVGERVRLAETEAALDDGRTEANEIMREHLRGICKVLKASFAKLSRDALDVKLEQAMLAITTGRSSQAELSAV
ncbi:MAG: hypothetical protein GY769_12645, partial [bacterium]|nr:hypothetical protein [bacterium]